MKELGIPKLGKLGNTVTYQTRYGQVTRRLATPRDPKSAVQVNRRTAFGRARFLWRTITDDQRAAWHRTARDRRTRRTLNQSGRLSGYLLFVKLNCNLAAIGRPMVSDPPRVPRFGRNPVDPLTITNTSGVLSFKLSLSARPAHDIVVLGTRPRSAGVSFVDHFVILGLLPEPAQGLSDITDLVLARFPVIPVGSRIFIQTLQHSNGWQDLPQQTSALVPAP
jgi:hypothetical protein